MRLDSDSASGSGSGDALSPAELLELAMLSNALHRAPLDLPPDAAARIELLESGLFAMRRLDRPDIEAGFLSEVVRVHRTAGRSDEAREWLRGYEALATRAPWNGPWLHVHALILASDDFPGPAPETLDVVQSGLAAAEGAAAARLACVLAGLRVERRIDYGTPDMAARMHAIERAAFEELEGELRSERAPHVARHAVAVALAGGSYAAAVRAADLALADPTLSGAGESFAAPLRLRRAMARWMGEQAEEGAAARALEAFGAADGDALSPEDRWLEAIWRSRAHLELENRDASRRELDRAVELAGDDPLRRARTAAARAWARRAGVDTEPVDELSAELRVGYDALLDAWRRAPVFEGGVGFLYYSMRRSVPAEAIHLLAERGRGAYEEEALSLVLRAHALGSSARALALAPVTLPELRRDLLGEGEGLLVYLPSKGGSHVFAIDADDVLHAVLADEEELRQAVVEFQEEISREPSLVDGAVPESTRVAAVEQGRALGRLLLPSEIARRVRSWSAVVVTGHDWLGWVPFECIAPVDGEPLGRTHALRSVPTLSFGHHLATRTARPDPRVEVTVFAAPSRPDVPRIPFGSAEAARWTRAFPTARTEVGLGVDVTRRAVLACDTRVLTILAHGGYERSRERPASLLLSPDRDVGFLDDGEFTCRDAEGMAFAADIVVLAACGAARGPSRVGDDGVSHLGGAFLGAGARTVIVSRAAVDYAATVLLLDEFHARLAAGDAPSVALFGARRARFGGPLDHPYFHSLVQVVGR